MDGSDSMTEIGKYLRTYRVNHNITLKQMADMFGLNASYLSAIEHGHREMNESFFKKIYNTLDIECKEDLDELYAAYLKTTKKYVIDMTKISEDRIPFITELIEKLPYLSGVQLNKISEVMRCD